MSEPDLLPRFRNPPLDEVAVGVQFSAPGFLPTHYGAFHDRLRSTFPRAQVLAPLPPLLPERFGSSIGWPGLPQTMPLLGMPPWPRVLYVSEDDCSLVQLQSDRLYFNWRKRPDNSYAHYEYLRAGFRSAYSAFEAFAIENGFGPVIPQVCDITYVNPLPKAATGADASSPETVFRLWSSDIGPEWPVPVQDLAFNARYQLLDKSGEPFGRLFASLSTVLGSNNEPMFNLELASRGSPRDDTLDGVLAFHDEGHNAIVRVFAAITSPEMHLRWGRYQ